MKKYLYIIIAFSFSMFFITLIMIANKNTKMRITNIEKGIDLYSTYDMNDLNIEEKNMIYNNMSLCFVQISNLINEDVENKINIDLQNNFQSLVDDNYYENVNYEITGNFSNIFSINIFGNNPNTMESKYIYLNYNLNDGSYIKFEDLFISDVELLPIIRKAFFNTTAKDNFLTKYEYNTYMMSYKSYEIDVHDRLALVNEDVVNNTSIKYNNSSNKNFSIYDNQIYIYSSNMSNSNTKNTSLRGLIKYIDYYQYMMVYSKYSNESSLYKTNIASLKNLPVCVDFFDDELNIVKVGNELPNMYVDFKKTPTKIVEKIDDNKKEQYLKINSLMFEKVNEQIEDIKIVAKKDKKHMYIVFVSLDNGIISNFEKGDLIYSNSGNFEVIIKTYKFDKKEYDNKYYKDLFVAYQKGLNRKKYKTIQEYEILNKKRVTITTDKSYYTYNFMTGEEIKTLDDMFIDDSITLDDLEHELRCSLEESNKTEKEIKDILKDGISYTFEKDFINIISNTNPNYQFGLDYNDIDISCFTIFDDDIKEKYKEVDDYEINVTSIIE